jgi:hypothetical protein
MLIVARQLLKKNIRQEHLRDLGYFNLARMKKQDKRNEYWLSRLQPRTKVFDGQPIDLLT